MEVRPSSPPKMKKQDKKEGRKNPGSTLTRSASRMHGGLTSPPTSAAPCGVSRSAAKSPRGGGRSPVSGSLPLRNRGQLLSSADLGGEVQRSAGERQEGRHCPSVPAPSPDPPFCDRGLLHKRLCRLCLQHQSSGGDGLRECDAASGARWTVGVQRADIS